MRIGSIFPLDRVYSIYRLNMLDIPSKTERDMQQGPLSEFPTAKTKKRFNQKFGNVLIYWQSAKRNGNSCFFPIQWVMQKVRSRNISVQKAFLRPSSEESEEPLKRKREKKKKGNFSFSHGLLADVVMATASFSLSLFLKR